MTALYHNTPVRVIRIETHRAYIVWHGKVRRVNKSALEGTGEREQATDRNRDSGAIPCPLLPVPLTEVPHATHD